jgi:hypothetical protein
MKSIIASEKKDESLRVRKILKVTRKKRGRLRIGHGSTQMRVFLNFLSLNINVKSDITQLIHLII